MVLAGLVGSAWAALVWLEQTPWAALLHGHVHGEAHGSGLGPDPPVGAADPFAFIVFLGGWLLMTVAMMLPATTPLVEIFRRMVAAKRYGPQLVALLIVGYLAAWTGFGVIVGAARVTLHAGAGLADHSTPPAWMLSAGLLGLAGAFQFSRLKYRCLERCRAPLGFVASRWRGRRERLAAFRIGLDHGMFCVGCCWALMLLMFAVGSAHLSWMLVLAVVMGAEKTVSWGSALATGTGVALMVAAGLVVAAQLGGSIVVG